MSQDTNTSSTVGRALLVGLLILATLGFGLAGLCGGAFTIMMLPDLLRTGPENYGGAFLIISVPCLVIGGALAWWCGRKLSRLLSRAG